MFGQVIKVFFDKSGHNFKTAGILLKFPSCSIRLWATLGGILQDGGAHKAASDMLSKVGVTKMFIVTVVLQTDFPFKPQCDAVLALGWLVDLIVAVPTVTIHPSRILAASEDFLERFLFLLGKEIASAWKGSTEFPRGMLEIWRTLPKQQASHCLWNSYVTTWRSWLTAAHSTLRLDW